MLHWLFGSLSTNQSAFMQVINVIRKSFVISGIDALFHFQLKISLEQPKSKVVSSLLDVHNEKWPWKVFLTHYKMAPLPHM